MARKDVFSSVMGAPAAKANDLAPRFVARSASRSIMQSFEDLSKSAVVELPPDLVDASFVEDRLAGDIEEYHALLDSIRTNGQDTPILVRPHPTVSGRYQTVFGHRRLRAARDLQRPVRAVVREIADREHLIAQGQENAARSNLSFIERTMFAQQVLGQGHSTETLVTALVLDETTLSKMRSVLGTIPVELIRAIGPAKGVGRDRWWQLSKYYERLSEKDREVLLAAATPASQLSEARFEAVFAAAARAGAQGAKRNSGAAPLSKRSWASKDKGVSVSLLAGTKKATVTLKAKEGPRFAEFITDRLEELYEDFRRSQLGSTGD